MLNISSQGTNESSTNLKVIKTELKASGEAVQLVRPLATTSKSAEEIIGELVNQFDYKSKHVKASENELHAVQQAFGSNLAQELIKTYDGSNLTADSQQDLVGDRYLAKQIEIIQHQQKTSSILDKWSHLLYEGEKEESLTNTSVTSSGLAGGGANANGQNGLAQTSLRVINKSSSYNSLLAKQQQRQIEEQIQHAQQMQHHHHQQQHQHNHSISSTAATATPPAHDTSSLRHSRSGNNYSSVQTLISNQFQNKIESQRQSASEIQSLMETQQISIGSGTVQEDSRRQSAHTSIGGGDDEMSSQQHQQQQNSRRQSMHTSLGSGTIQDSRRSSALDESSRRQSAQTGISSTIEETSRRQSGHMLNFSSALDDTESSRRQSNNTQSVLDSSHGQYTSVGSSVLEESQSRRQSAHTSIALSALEQSRLQSIHTSIGSSVMEESTQASRRQSTQASRASSMREHARAQALLDSHAHSQADSEQAEYRAEYERHYDQTQANLARSRSHTAQQPQPYLPQLSSSNLNAVQLDAYESPQFKAMLEQLLKPLNLPPEQINYPADWPSQDKIHLLAEPIYIPAPQPIVIPAPNILTIQNHPLEKSYTQDLPPDAIKPTVTYYPSIATDQAYMKGFGIRQINTN